MSLARVFLAMRSEYLRERFRMVLEFEDFTVATAGDNAACLQAIKNVVPEVLVIEADLPDGCVEGVLEAMNGDPQLNGIAVVVLARQARLVSLRETTRFPICDYLAPPTSYTQLVACVRQVVAQRGQNLSMICGE